MDASVGFGGQSRNVNVSNQKKSKERKKANVCSEKEAPTVKNQFDTSYHDFILHFNTPLSLNL